MTPSNLIKYQILASIVLLIFIPSNALALAGIGEHDTTFHYNKYTQVRLEHPGQFCIRDGDRSDLHCLKFVRESYEDFKGLESSLEEINVPIDESSPFIIARRSSDSKWLIYDLEIEQHLIRGVSYNEALTLWLSMNLFEPNFVDTINPEKFLHETAASKKRRFELKLVLLSGFGWLPMLILAVILGVLTTKVNRQYKKEGSKEYLIISRLLKFLTGMAALFVLAAFGFLLCL